MSERKELVFARQFRKLLENKTLGTGKWIDLVYQESTKACDFIQSLLDKEEKELKPLLKEIKVSMREGAEKIAAEFSGSKEWDEYCEDSKAIIERIDKYLNDITA